MTTDDFAELHGDDFYLNLSNDQAKPGMVFLSLTSRESSVEHNDVPEFALYQYCSIPELRKFINELIVVMQRVKRDSDG